MAYLNTAPDAIHHDTPAVDEGAFTIYGADAAKKQAGQLTDATNAVQFDWSGVDDALNKMAGAGAFAVSRANGQNLSGGSEAAMQQDNGMDGPQTAAGLAQTLLAKGKAGAGQADQQARGQATQQAQAMQFAAQLQQSQTAAKMNKAQMQMDLQNAKFDITNQLTQATNGLSLAQASLRNAYLNTLGTAKNETEAMNINTNYVSNTNTLGTISMAVGAGAAATSALAQSQTKPTGAPGA